MPGGVLPVCVMTGQPDPTPVVVYLVVRPRVVHRVDEQLDVLRVAADADVAHDGAAAAGLDGVLLRAALPAEATVETVVHRTGAPSRGRRV